VKLSTERVREHRAHAESQGASATTFQPGQPFNPHGLFYGVFVPEALVRCKDLSPGAKLAYGRLVRYAGQDGACHPRQETLAVELGVSGRQVRTYLGELSRHRFLRAVRKGLHAPNDYIFLWHTIFDGTDRSGSSCRDRKDTSCQDRKDTSCQDRKGTSTQDRQRVSAPERKKTSFLYQESPVKRVRYLLLIRLLQEFHHHQQKNICVPRSLRSQPERPPRII